MKPLPLKKRLLAVSAFLMGFTFIYSLLNILTLPYSRTLSALRLDEDIPFLAPTIVFYFSHYYFVFFSLISFRNREEFEPVLIRTIILSLSCFAIFALVPISVVRPGLPEGFWQTPFKILYGYDGSANCLPSLHAGIAALLALSHLGLYGKSRWPWLVWAILIILSTLTTKQHLILDVLAGMLLAFGVYMVPKKLLFRERNHYDGHWSHHEFRADLLDR
jgi:membrane-associated phospholipid phosphatase